jgi:spermidine synthase
MVSFQLAQKIPFNAEVFMWDNQQLMYLSALMLLLSVPFFFAASAICIAFIHFQESLSRIYAADLGGAAVGSLLIILLLFEFQPQHALVVISLISLFSAVFVLPALTPRTSRKVILLVFVVALLAAFNAVYLELSPSPYKSQSQALQIQGSEIIHVDSSPLGLLTVVRNEQIPFRHAPGLSIHATQAILPQLSLFTDAGNAVAINHFPSTHQEMAYLASLTSAAAYVIGKPDRALIVGAGGGTDLLQAIYFGVQQVHALEINPQVVAVVDQIYGKYSGHIYSNEKVTTHITEVRDHLGSGKQKYPLIQLSLIDGNSTASSGMHALNESYLYTTEAMQLYLGHLAENGYLSLTRWISLPPRDSLKLFNTAVTALKGLGIQNASQHIVFIRNWQTGTILIKKEPFNQNERDLLRQFNQSNAFDAVWIPGMESSEANRYNRLSSAVFHDAAVAILSDEQRQDFIDNYKFNLETASDDQPYFHHFFRWSTFKELLALRNQGGMQLIEWGYLVLLATLAISVISSVVLILIPLMLFANKPHQAVTPVSRIRVVYYFFAIGIAFLMIEIAFMQKFILLLHHPLYSFSGTLAIFLLFAGIGSHVSGRLLKRWQIKQVLLLSCLGIGLIGLAYLWLLEPVFEIATTLAMPYKVLLSIVLLGPLAFLMGMPFPTGLSLLSQKAEHYIPWAWGINGCASVISASLSTLLAIDLGFNVVIGIGLVLYLSVLVFFPFNPSRRIQGSHNFWKNP